MSTDLDAMADGIGSPRDFASFLARFATEVERKPDEWNNVYLSTFLEAMDRWISSSIDNADTIGGQLVRQQPSWKLFGRLLLAAAT